MTPHEQRLYALAQVRAKVTRKATGEDGRTETAADAVLRDAVVLCLDEAERSAKAHQARELESAERWRLLAALAVAVGGVAGLCALGLGLAGSLWWRLL